MSNNPHPWLLPTQKRGPAELADQDENLVQIATDLPEDPEELYTAKSGTKNGQRKDWGNVFQVPVNAPSSIVGLQQTGQLIGALNTPSFDEETDCTVILQILPSQSTIIPVPPSSGTGLYFAENQVLAVISYGVGAATLTKRVTLSSPALRRVQLCARNVQVSLQSLYVNPPKTGSIAVAVAVVPGHMALRDAYTWMQSPVLRAGDHSPIWPPSALYATSGQSTPDLAQGVVGNLKATLTATSAPGTPYYLMLMDLPPTYAGLTGVELPMQYGVSPAMLNVGDSVSFNGLEMPEACTFTNGLWVALSTTVNIYTPVPASPSTQMCFDALIGQ